MCWWRRLAFKGSDIYKRPLDKYWDCRDIPQRATECSIQKVDIITYFDCEEPKGGKCVPPGAELKHYEWDDKSCITGRQVMKLGNPRERTFYWTPEQGYTLPPNRKSSTTESMRDDGSSYF